MTSTAPDSVLISPNHPVSGEPMELGPFLEWMSGQGPYLQQLAEKQGAWLQSQGSRAAGTLADDLLGAFDDLPLEEEPLKQGLRRTKQKLHLLCAVLDLGGQWDWVPVTDLLTRFADKAVQKALGYALQSADMPADADGIFLLAMGKYGAFELNYSSDIDFTCFYDPDILPLPEGKDPARILMRLVRRMVGVLEEATADGYVFRTDLRLRPDPGSNAVAVTTQAADRYYETFGQNWERAAHIKARVCAGDDRLGQAFLDEIIQPFVWRRTLDFATIADIQALTRQIQAQKGRDNYKVPGHNLKLGIGGIREIEFFVQTQQLVLGGRHSELRSPRTVDGLSGLAEAGFIEREAAKTLTQAYGALRQLEHRCQMIADQQTHSLPERDDDRARIAAMAGFGDLEAFDAHMAALLKQVHQLCYPEDDQDSLASDMGSLSFTGVDPHPETLETLQKLGFDAPERAWRLMSKWLGGRIPATRTERARALLTTLAPRIIEAAGRTGAADTALAHFGDFLSGLVGGVSTLSMFVSTPNLLDDVIDIMGLSPRLAQVLSRHPAIMDAMIDPNFYTPLALQNRDALSGKTGPDLSFDEALDAARIHVRERQFQIGVHILGHHLTPEAAGLAFSELADESLQAMFAAALREMQRLHGKLDAEFAVLGLGKFGSREMSIGSDLDLMLIYDVADGVSESVGGRPIAPAVYAARLTQRLIGAMSAPTPEGEMYEVDMALRPSGKAGPVAVSLSAFESYYPDRAWTWEFMALTRARVVTASSEDFADNVRQHVKSAFKWVKQPPELTEDVLDMRARLLKDKAPRKPWDIKRLDGGLIDIEFIAQYLSLKDPDHIAPGTAVSDVISSLADRGQLDRGSAKDLKDAHTAFMRYSQIRSLMTKGLIDLNEATQRMKDILRQALGGSESDEIIPLIDRYAAKVRNIRDQIMK